MTAATGTPIEPLDDRDVRALTEYMSVLPHIRDDGSAEGQFSPSVVQMHLRAVEPVVPQVTRLIDQ